MVQSSCSRLPVDPAKIAFLVLGFMLAGAANADAATVTAQCQIVASVGVGTTVVGARKPPPGVRLGIFTLRAYSTGTGGGNAARSWAEGWLAKGLHTCYRDALRSGRVPPSCTARQNHGNGWSEVHGWRWSGTQLKDSAVRRACGSGWHGGKQVTLWVSCFTGPRAARIWRGPNCPRPRRPAPALPNLPPEPREPREPQQELSLVCQRGAVVNGECRCVPGSKPKLIGPKAYLCVRPRP